MSNTNVPSIDSLRPEYNKLKAIQYLYSAVKELQQEGFASFDSSSSYSKGDIVQKDGKLYEFTTSHTGDWNENDVQETTLDNIIQSKTSSIETTYSELKSLRDNSQLIPGCWYRITDYVTTVSSIIELQARSVGHPFDILVLATSVNTLSEEARAIKHEGGYDGIYVSDGVPYVYTGRKVIVHFTDITKELYLWKTSEIYSSTSTTGYYCSKLSLEELKELTQEELSQTLWDYFADSDVTVISDNEIQVDDGYEGNLNTWDNLFDEYSFNPYFSNSNLNAWQLKYTLDNIQWTQQAGIYVFDEADDYVFQHIGEIELDGTQYHLLKGLGYYVEDWGDYAVCEDFEVGTYIIAYRGNPDEFDPEDRAGVITSIENVTDAGKGTITFLKDEFNNECPYDFKNIQFKRYMATDSVTGRTGLNGLYMVVDPNNCARNLSVEYEGDFIWAFTFSSDSSGGEQIDYSLGGHSVYENTFREYDDLLPNNVMFGENNYGNIIGIKCYNNSWGDNCYNNSWGNNCANNSWGTKCCDNVLGNNCFGNSWGEYCNGNSCGNNYSINFWSSFCQSNVWGNNCNGNSCGAACYSNIWGNNCFENSLGNSCSFNSCGNNCYGNYCGNEVTYTTLFDGVKYTQITAYVKYAQVLNGVAGTTSNKLALTFAANKNYTQVATLNSSGQLKIYVPGDLVQ